MITKLIIGGGVAVIALAPMAFSSLIAGPQAANEYTNVSAACQMVLGMAPQPDSTVGQLGGAEAAAVAATLTQPSAADLGTGPTTTIPALPVDELLGERAYAFVTSLNTLDNWRTLPAEQVARWAIDPPNTAPPSGAVPLAALPEAQTSAVLVDDQPATAYQRGCAAVIGRATAIDVTPAGAHPGQPAPDPAVLAQTVGQVMSNVELLRTVNPGADKDDPRQFYLDYRPATAPAPGDIVVYDFTMAGPAHFGIALDEQQMLTTGSAAGGPVLVRPIPANSSAMSPTTDADGRL
ncbi:MAG: hypothetical protein AB7G47_19370 [Mycolicibacterium sp.]|uniref:hypothetical protein n=1 Tax=Mycolicibacterium sp. TaxID=2320850 RepID=UPI003D0C38CF